MAAFHVAAFWLVTISLLSYQPKQISRENLNPDWCEEERLKKKGGLGICSSKKLRERWAELYKLSSCQRRIFWVPKCAQGTWLCDCTFWLHMGLVLSNALNFHINSRTAAKGKNPESPGKGKKSLWLLKEIYIRQCTGESVETHGSFPDSIRRHPLGILRIDLHYIQLRNALSWRQS